MSKSKEKTIRDRVEDLYSQFFVKTNEPVEGEKARFVSAILELLERAKSPGLFCPKCDQRMSLELETGNLSCFNCGYEKKNLVTKIGKKEDGPQFYETTPKTAITRGGKPDPRLLEAIDQAEKETPPKPAKKNLGDAIRKLADGRGSPSVTAEDEAQIKNIPGVPKNSQINWV